MPVPVKVFFERWAKDFTHNNSCFTTSQRMELLAARLYGNDPAEEKPIEAAAQAKLTRLVAIKKAAMKKVKPKAHDDTEQPIPASLPIPMSSAVPAAAVPPLATVSTPRGRGMRRASSLNDLRRMQAHDSKHAVDASHKNQPSPKSGVDAENRVSYEFDSHVPTKNRYYNPFHAVAMACGSIKQAGCQLIDNIASWFSKKWQGKQYREPTEPVPSNILTGALKFFLVVLPFGVIEGLSYLCLSTTLGTVTDMAIDAGSKKNRQTITVDINDPDTVYRSDNFREAVKPVNLTELANGKKSAHSASRAVTPGTVSLRAATPATTISVGAARPQTGKSTGRQPRSGRRTATGPDVVGEPKVQVLTINIDTARGAGPLGAETPIAAAATTVTPANATTGGILGLLSPLGSVALPPSPNGAVVGHVAPPPSPSQAFASIAASPKGAVELVPLSTVAGPAAKFAVNPVTPKPVEASRPQSADASVFQFTRTRSDN